MAIFGLKILLGILKLLPTFQFEFNIPVLDNFGTVSNYFAWANYFIPTDTIVFLLGLTALFYTFKLSVRIFKAVKDFV